MDWGRMIQSFNAGATQLEIAAKYGIAQSAISDTFNTDRDLQIASLRKIAEAEDKPVWRLVQLAEKYGRQRSDHRAVA
jgi:transcriptional regulator with XRE-family HTH domain